MGDNRECDLDYWLDVAGYNRFKIDRAEATYGFKELKFKANGSIELPSPVGQEIDITPYTSIWIDATGEQGSSFTTVAFHGTRAWIA